MKAYILIKESIPLGFAITAAAHAGAAIMTKFGDHPDTQEWAKTSFKKVVCRVTEEQFNDFTYKLMGDRFVLSESALNNEEIAIVFRPMKDWPKEFKYLSLYR